MELKPCKDRIRYHYNLVIKDLRKLYNSKNYEDENLGNIFDYGLSYDYVAPNTFKNQKRGYILYQLSWGGPSDEFRFYLNDYLEIEKIEYWFMDWFDGAHITVKSERDLELLCNIYELFGGAENARYIIKKSGE